MAIERSWEAVSPVAFVANGGADGTITLLSTAGFKVKQSVVISAISLPDKKLEVKKVISPTKLIVGPVVTTGKLLARENLSAYTLGNLPTIRAEEQKKSVLPIADIIQAVYRQEPGTTIGVEIDDQWGNPIDSVRDNNGVNRLAVDGQFTAEVDVQVDVDIDGYYDAVENPDPDNIGLIAHTRSEDTDETDQIQRITAKRGTVDENTVSQDVAIHDHNGNQFTDGNPLKTSDLATRTVLQTEFDATQVKLDTLNTTLQTESDQTQTLLQTEFDATQALLATEFNETQVKLDTLTTVVQNEFDATQTLIQTESDQTQTILQTEFDQTQVKQDLTNTKLEELKTITQTEFDATQILLQTEFDQTQTKQDTSNSLLTQIRDYADTLEILIASSNTLLTNIGNNTDGLETLVTATNALLTTIRDNADTIETLINTSNTQLTAINANTDGLEGLLTSTNALLTTIRDNADTVEILLANIGNNTDGLEGLITASNALLTTIRDNADTIETLITSTNAKLDIVNINLTNIQTEIDSSNYTMNEAFNKAQAIAGQLDDVGTTVATENNIAPIRITPQRGLHTNLRDATGSELLGIKTSILSIPFVRSQDQTYAASATAFICAAAATDVFTISGSATKTIKILKVKVSGSTTSGSAIKFTASLIKRSTANTGGTSVIGVNAPYDSINSAATSTVRHYTVNPTALGTSVGSIRAESLAITASGLAGGVLEWSFEDNGQPVVLRGATEFLAVNFNAATISGPVISISIEWVEV